jgi:hypothetical protein
VGFCQGAVRRVGTVASLVVVLLLGAPRTAHATEDAAVSELVERILDEDYMGANFNEAKKKLAQAMDRCSRGRCTGQTRAQIWMVMGMVSAQLGAKDDAITQFGNGLKEDPNAHLPQTGLNADIRALFAEALRQANEGGSSTSEEPTATPPSPREKPHIAGWSSTEAFELASAAVAADQVGRLDECIERNKKSLGLEEQPRTRLHLASCEARSGKLIDALQDAQKALKLGIERRDAPVMRAARQRVSDLLPRIPHVTFVPPAGAGDLTVTFDERPVPNQSLTKKFSIDPGKHTVHAEGTLNSIPLTFDRDYDVKEAELVTVQIVLVSQAPEYLTPGQLKCMLSAKSQEEVVKCLPQNRKNLVVKAGFDVGGYSDTDHVNVLTPSINGSVSSPTAGWNIGGTYLVDIITAASPDIVSEASQHFREVRNAGTLTGGYKPGLYGAQATVNVSEEPDYLSFGGGLALTADLRDKLITPRVAGNYSHDIIGRAGTPYNVFHHNLDTSEVEAGLTLVLSPTSLLMLSATLQLERGDQSKPYRYVPMFDPVAVAPFIPAGATIDLVNHVRLPLRPLEQLPTERNRYAVGARFAHRFSASTLRIEERIYYDTWLQKASTTDLRYIMDLSRRIRVWPHLRFNAQSGTNFYQLAYSAAINPTLNQIVLPTYRTGDRELSPLMTGTAGGGLRIALTSPESKTQYGFQVQGDAMYTRFFNSLFVTERTGVYGTIGLDAEFE